MAEFRLPGALQPGFRCVVEWPEKAGDLLSPPDLWIRHRIRRGSEARAVSKRAPALARPGSPPCRSSFVASAQAEVLSSRIWPAKDYTRLTLESKEPVDYTIFSLKDPERLVIDLETSEISPALAELNGKVAADDPYIQGLRVARNRPGVVRLVLDLKAEVKPQIFTLPPIADYGHRLVLDIHPLVAVDPLAVLIEETQQRPVPARAGQAAALRASPPS